MTYVFDSCALITLFTNFYPSRFPSLWEKFEESIADGTIISVREVYKEIEDRDNRLGEWTRTNRDFFCPSPIQELVFVAEIFTIPHFQDLIRRKERLQGKPVADPFVIAKSKVIEGCVVTQEVGRPNAVRIPNVCEHFNIRCLNLEGFMEEENWTF